MKPAVTFVFPPSQVRPYPANRRWIGLGLVLLAAVLLICGCSQKKSDAANNTVIPSADTNPAPAQTERPAAPAPASAQVAVAPVAHPIASPPAVPASVVTAPGGGADLKDLNHAYIRWVVQSHDRAKTFEDFVARSGTSVPAAPAGKKYIIDKAGFIALVNQ